MTVPQVLPAQFLLPPESATSRTETVCAGPERMREVFVSTSHKVEVRLVVKRQQELGYFMLRYEGAFPLQGHVWESGQFFSMLRVQVGD